MANKNEAKINFTADCRELNAQISKSNSTMQTLRAELKLNETQMKATGESVEGLEQKHSLLQKQLDVSKDKVAALQGKLDAAIRNFGEGSNEVDKWRTQLLNAQNAEERLRKAVRDCSDALDEQKKHTEAVNEGFAKMGETMADLAKGGIVAASGALVAAGTVAVTTANDIDKATNTFIAQTGASAEEAGKFEDVMTNIYNNNYGESFEDIAASMATVKTAMGDIGTDELEKVTTDALTLRDTFDMDVNESIRAVNSMMDQFGISSDEAFNLLAQGAQNGLNQNGDLLDIINEYSVQFENAGYSADDMFNMLANGVESGTWSVDKLGDAVKEFNIRMSDGSAKDAVEALGFSWEEVSAAWSKGGDDAKEVFNMLFNELDGLENTTEGYGIGVGLLGTMYEDLGQDAILALSSTKGEISSTKDAMAEINAVKYDDLGSALEGIGRNLQTSLAEPIKTEVMPAVNEFIQDVDWQGVGNTIASAFGTVVEGAVAVATAIKDATVWMTEHKGVVVAVAAVIGTLVAAITLYNAVQAIKTAMDAAQVTTIWGLVAAHIAQAAAAMAAIAPYILIVAAIAAVIAIIVLLVKNWDIVVEACKKAWETIKEATSKAWEAIKQALSKAWDAIKQAFSKATEAVKNAVSKAWNVIKTTTSNVWNAIKSAVSNVWNGIKSGVSSAINAVKSTVSSVWNSVKSTTSSIWNGIKSAISNVWNGIKSGVSTAVNAVKSTVSNVFNSIKSTATSVWNAIKSAITNPIDAAKQHIRGALDAIKGFFSGLKLEFPKIKLPHFSISGSFSLNPPSVPKLSVSWYKDGGIFTQPTIFNTPYGLKGVGEAGAEAVLPIDRLEGYIFNAIERAQNVVSFDTLAAAIEDLASRPIELAINGRQFAVATASDGDSVNGLRNTFKSRGLVMD